MPNMRISEPAALLGVSYDTHDAGWNRAGWTIEGRKLAAFAQQLAESPEPGNTTAASARNRLRRIVTRVQKDGVMAQVEMQAGPFRVVSLMSREAADELGLEPGVVAVASIKSTHVVVEIPEA
jgi:molybdopterin-binding protein